MTTCLKPIKLFVWSELRHPMSKSQTFMRLGAQFIGEAEVRGFTMRRWSEKGCASLSVAVLRTPGSGVVKGQLYGVDRPALSYADTELSWSTYERLSAPVKYEQIGANPTSYIKLNDFRVEVAWLHVYKRAVPVTAETVQTFS